MNKYIIQIAIAFVGAITLLTSCQQDEPVKPSNEIHNKLHETAFEAIYTLTEATLRDGVDFDANPKLTDVVPSQNVQKIHFKNTEARGWHITETSPMRAFSVKNKDEAPNTVYLLHIDYLNAEGKSMNHQFITNGQDKIHQHFFALYSGGLLVQNKNKLHHEYRYADTTPWDSPTGEHTGDKNPIGFDGLLRFSGTSNFVMNVDLVHAFVSKYEADGSLSPFYAPSRRLRAESDQDVSVKLPIHLGQNKGTESEQPKEEEPKQPGGEQYATGEYGKLNKTNVAKISIKLYEGHLHAPGEQFHYVAGPIMAIPNLRMDQEIVLVYEDGVWRSAPNTTYKAERQKIVDESGAIDERLVAGAKTLSLDRLFFKGSKINDGMPAPIYGCWIEYYDASGILLNSTYASEGTYQHIFNLRNIEPFGSNAITSEATATNVLMNYTYKDTTPWNKSASKEHAKPTKLPIGLKGFFDFKRTGFKARLEIDLRKLNNGKTDKYYMTPIGSESQIKVSIPIYVPNINVDAIIGDYDDEEVPAWDGLTPQQKTMATDIMNALEVKTWDELYSSLIRILIGDRAGENSGGVWF